MQKTNEIKIIEYNDGKRSYYCVLVYDTKRRFWREITSDVGRAGVLIMCAQSIFNDNGGGDDNVKKQSR